MRKALLVLFLLSGAVNAASYTYKWTAAAAGAWNVAGNWTSSNGGTHYPGFTGETDTAVFDSVANGGSIQNVTTFGAAALSMTTLTINVGYTGTITQDQPLTVTGTWTNAGGTFNGGTGAISVGAFSMTGGVFNGGSAINTFTTWACSAGAYTATSSTTTQSGATFVLSGTGTFAHNNGTWAAGASTALSITPNGCTFYNLSLDYGNSAFATGSTTYVANNFTTTGTNSVNNSTTATVYVTGNYTCGANAGCGLLVTLNASSGTQIIANGSGNGLTGQITLAQTGTAGLTITGPISVANWTTSSQGSGAVTQTGLLTMNVANGVTWNSGSLVFPGNVTLSTGGNLVLSTTLYVGGNFIWSACNQVTGGGTFAVAGNFTYNPTSKGGVYTCGILINGSSGGTQTLTQAGGAIALPTGGMKVSITGGGNAVFASNFTFAAAANLLEVNTGILDLAGYALSTCTVQVDAAGTLKLQGGETFTSVTIGTLAAGSLVYYYGSGAYTSLKLNYSYSNLTFNGTGAWTLPTALTVGGALVIGPSAATVKFLASSTQTVSGSTTFSNATVGSSTLGTTTSLNVSGASTWTTMTVYDIHNINSVIIRANSGSQRGNQNTTGIVYDFEDQACSQEY